MSGIQNKIIQCTKMMDSQKKKKYIIDRRQSQDEPNIGIIQNNKEVILTKLHEAKLNTLEMNVKIRFLLELDK